MASCALPLAALPASALADSMSSYSGQANDAQAKREAKERANYLSDANEHSLVYLGQAVSSANGGAMSLRGSAIFRPFPSVPMTRPLVS